MKSLSFALVYFLRPGNFDNGYYNNSTQCTCKGWGGGRPTAGIIIVDVVSYLQLSQQAPPAPYLGLVSKGAREKGQLRQRTITRRDNLEKESDKGAPSLGNGVRNGLQI